MNAVDFLFFFFLFLFYLFFYRMVSWGFVSRAFSSPLVCREIHRLALLGGTAEAAVAT
jgi:hypothetical protein